MNYEFSKTISVKYNEVELTLKIIVLLKVQF